MPLVTGNDLKWRKRYFQQRAESSHSAVNIQRAMITISVWGALRPAVGDRESITLDAGTIGELMRKLEEQYPRTQRFIDEGIAVSIDGTIYQDSWSQPLPADAEIYLLPRIAGG